jgi:hypothetical protein
MDMPVVSVTLEDLEINNNATDIEADGIVYLDRLLSEYYGKNIRQGNTFYLSKIQAQLKGTDSGVSQDFDVGGNATIDLKWCPGNKYARKAWNNVFRQWKLQKSYAGKIGPHMKNDDLEFAFHDVYYDARTSTIRGSGITTDEKLCLYGSSTAGNDFSLEDYVNSTMMPAQEPSRDHFTNQVIKDNKYGDTRFPAKSHVTMTSSVSHDVSKYSTLGNLPVTQTLYAAAQGQAGLCAFDSPVPVMCGIINYKVALMPEDTLFQTEDNFDLVLMFHVKRWKPLVFRPKARKAKKFTRKPRSSRRRTRGRRR